MYPILREFCVYSFVEFNAPAPRAKAQECTNTLCPLVSDQFRFPEGRSTFPSFSRCSCLPLPIPAVPVPAPQRPTLSDAMQFRLGPKFLLLSSAPASGGFLAEAVGTCQGSPLRFDR
jgi:hypothetical protein